MNMKCRTNQKLAAYQVGALNPHERAEVERHLHGCAACRAEMAALERTAQLLRPMPTADAPPQVWAHVARQLTPRHAGRRVAVPQRRNWMPAFAAAILVLIVALAVVLPLMHGHFAGAPSEVAYADLQLAAAWDTPLADKAALGLALLATEEVDPLRELQEVMD
jgi:anti-sigma factor RsiW